MLADKRKARRSVAKKEGRASINGRAEVACTVRDISALGARLKFAHPTFLPRQFRLAFDDQEQRVTVIWQAGLLAGVRFQTPLRNPPEGKRRAFAWLRG